MFIVANKILYCIVYDQVINPEDGSSHNEAYKYEPTIFCPENVVCFFKSAAYIEDLT